MPTIEINHSHGKSVPEARASIERMADSIAERFGIEYHWERDCMVFERPGVHGEILVEPGRIHVTVNLGFLLLALKGPVEAEIHGQLEREFGSDLPA